MSKHNTRRVSAHTYQRVTEGMVAANDDHGALRVNLDLDGLSCRHHLDHEGPAAMSGVHVVVLEGAGEGDE